MPAEHPPHGRGNALNVVAMEQFTIQTVLRLWFREVEKCITANGKFGELYAATADATDALDTIDRGRAPSFVKSALRKEMEGEADSRLLQNQSNGGAAALSLAMAAALLERAKTRHMAIPDDVSLESMERFIAQKRAQHMWRPM